MHRIAVLAAWNAALLLSWTGWGRRYWDDCPMASRTVLKVAGIIGIAGYFRISLDSYSGLLNCGWAGLALLIASLGMAKGKSAWWLGWTVLGLIAGAVRLEFPLVPIQAGVGAWFWPEALGMGLIAALWQGRPFPAALVATGAEIAAALLLWATSRESYNLGNRDLSVAITAGLSAWLWGWALGTVRDRFWQVPRGSA